MQSQPVENSSLNASVYVHYMGNDLLQRSDFSKLAQLLETFGVIANKVSSNIPYITENLAQKIYFETYGVVPSNFEYSTSDTHSEESESYIEIYIPTYELTENECIALISEVSDLFSIPAEKIIIQTKLNQTLIRFKAAKDANVAPKVVESSQQVDESSQQVDESSQQVDHSVKNNSKITSDLQIKFYNTQAFKSLMLALALTVVVAAALVIVALTLNPILLPAVIASVVTTLTPLTANLVFGFSIGAGAVATIGSGLLAHSLYSSHKSKDEEKSESLDLRLL